MRAILLAMAVDKVEVLRGTVLFGSLTGPELDALASRAVEQKLGRDEILFLAGDGARGLYAIAEGAVRAFRIGTDGREQVIHVERAGATVGEVPLFDGGPYPSNVAGEEESVLLFVAKSDFNRLVLEQPGIAIAALRVMAGRLRNCASLVETLSLHDVDRRLARLLLMEARERGRPGGKGVTFELQLTHQQIASRIGTVREVVSRAFGRLQQAGLLAMQNRKVTIHDSAAFRDYVERE